MTNLLDLALASFFLAFTFVATTFAVLASAFDKLAFHLHSPLPLLTCLF